MITPEIELRPIARRGMTTEELELDRYASAEFGGKKCCILTGVVKARCKLRETRQANEGHELLPAPSSSSAHA